MKILFYGDSITDMIRIRDYADGYPYALGTGYPFVVVSKLSEENPTKHEFVNRGISGNRIVDLYSRIKCDCWNHSPDVISVLIGVNDIWHELSSQNGVELDRFEKVYRMMVEDTLKRLPNVKFMLLEPFVLEGSETKEKIEQFNEVKNYSKVIQKIAKDYNQIFVPLQARFDEMAKIYGADTYLFDGVHPSVAGSTLIANEWMKAFKENVE